MIEIVEKENLNTVMINGTYFRDYVNKEKAVEWAKKISIETGIRYDGY